ncbi:MAG: hypothetical protein QG670_1981 [Thermoproteota archaeon]|nr:hypothetical protein [Thermoproteota archaeon]
MIPKKRLDSSTVMKNRNVSLFKYCDQSIISFFNRTPTPKTSQDVVYPHFYELKWAWGCPYDCTWCYLKGTFRYHLEEGRVKPHFKDRAKIAHHVKSFLEGMNEPTILNMGVS